MTMALFRAKPGTVHGAFRGKELEHDLTLAAFIYFVITLVFFFSCLKTMKDHLFGPQWDNMAYLWNMWWANLAARSPDIKLSYTNHIFYPEGTYLYFHFFSFYNLALSVLFSGVFGLTATYNLLILHSFVIAGIGAFLLVKYLTGDSYLAILGGFIFAFNPAHCAHSMYHMNIASIQFIPFFVLFYIKAIRFPCWKNLALASLFFLLVTLCSWTYFIFSFYFIILSYIYLAVRRRKVIMADVIIRASVVVGATLLILSPWLWKMILLKFSGSQGAVAPGGHNHSVADVWSFIMPSLYHPLNRLGFIHKGNILCTGSPWEKTVYLGFVNILIVVYAFKKTVKHTAGYFMAMLAFIILTMGTNMHFVGHITPVVLPYTIIKHIPFLANARCPSRAVMYIYVFWAVIVAFSLGSILKNMTSRASRRTFLSIVTALIFLDFMFFCGETTKVYAPACYDLLKKDKDRFAILELPTAYLPSERYMMYQTKHGIPILQGAVSRRSNSSLVDRLAPDLIKLKKQLIDNKVKYIVMHPELIFMADKATFGGEEKFDTAYRKKYAAVRKFIQQLEKYFKIIYRDDESLVFKVY